MGIILILSHPTFVRADEDSDCSRQVEEYGMSDPFGQADRQHEKRVRWIKEAGFAAAVLGSTALAVYVVYPYLNFHRGAGGLAPAPAAAPEVIEGQRPATAIPPKLEISPEENLPNPAAPRPQAAPPPAQTKEVPPPAAPQPRIETSYGPGR